MDMSNVRPTQGVSGAVGDDVTMKYGDWRTPLERERIVNKIMDILKRHLPFGGYERVRELKKIAERVENEIYTAATSQSEYSRMICLNMLTMDTRLQNSMADSSMESNSAAISVNPSVPFYSTASGGDWQEEVYQKINTMKDLYLLDLMPYQPASDAFGDPTMEYDDWRAQLQAESRQRIVNKIIDTLKSHSPFSGYEGLQELKKIAVRFEEKIYTVATSQSDYLRKISLKMLSMENISQNPMSGPTQSNSTANGVNPSHPGSQVMQQGQQLSIPVEYGDWRGQLQAEPRQRIVNKILDTLKKHIPFDGHEGLQELKKIAVRFEERMYTDCTSQADYLRKISLKMLTIETRS